jgi:hypothetical protein
VGRHPLEGITLKLARSEEHLGALHNSMERFLQSQFYEPVAEANPERGVFIRVENVQEPPPEWELLIGEFVYNVRSAVDHLAYELARLHLGDPLPVSIATSSEFPIFNNGRDFRFGRRDKRGRRSRRPGVPGSGLHKIRGVSQPARTAIERLQPYHRRKNPGAGALWLLEELSNIDKHRQLHLTTSQVVGSRYGIETTAHGFELRGIKAFPCVIEKGATVAHLDIRGLGPGEKMKVEAEIAADITFDRASPSPVLRERSVRAVLFQIVAFVAGQVMPTLFPLFPGIEVRVHHEDPLPRAEVRGLPA